MAPARRNCKGWKAYAADGCKAGVVAIGSRATIRPYDAMNELQVTPSVQHTQKDAHFVDPLNNLSVTVCGC